mmetsp:Transcript_32394/g.79007  ORF Transcript_32394/g.79007 Transcript_32394/m.79007 type:complete len:146 (-) Transcript_32394:592-1029(-)
MFVTKRYSLHPNMNNIFDRESCVMGIETNPHCLLVTVGLITYCGIASSQPKDKDVVNRNVELMVDPTPQTTMRGVSSPLARINQRRARMRESCSITVVSMDAGASTRPMMIATMKGSVRRSRLPVTPPPVPPISWNGPLVDGISA